MTLGLRRSLPGLLIHPSNRLLSKPRSISALRGMTARQRPFSARRFPPLDRQT